MIEFVVRALHVSGYRGTVLRDWEGFSMEALWGVTKDEELVACAEKNALFAVDQAPHERIFPRVSWIVHHGGAGTTILPYEPEFLGS